MKNETDKKSPKRRDTFGGGDIERTKRIDQHLLDALAEIAELPEKLMSDYIVIAKAISLKNSSR